MNVACNKCPAKYAVPDDKIRGRKVRITCKRCGAPIIVDGTQLSTEKPAVSPAKVRARTMLGGLEPPPGSAPGAVESRPPPKPEPEPQPEPQPPPAAEPEPWTVAVTEEDQREMTTGEVVRAYADGLIDLETFVWREGMEDWLTPFEIPEIARALEKRGLSPPGPQREEEEQEPTRVAQSPLGENRPLRARSGHWREPGRWEPPEGPESQEPISFDDVTVAMAAPKAQALLEAAQAKAPVEEPKPEPAPEQPAAPSAPAPPEQDMDFDEDEATVVADSRRFGVDVGMDRDSHARPFVPLPAAGAPARAKPPEPEMPAPARPEPERKLPAAAPPEPTAEPPSPAAPPARRAKLPRPAQPEPRTGAPEPAGAPSPELAAARDSGPEIEEERPSAAVREDRPGGDLFSRFDQAGSEEEELARPPMPSYTTERAGEESSLTGARHETSVLFSLDALAKKDAPPSPRKKGQDKDADFLLASPSPPVVSDEATGSADGQRFFAPAMAAPDFTAPPAPSAPSQPSPEPAQAAEKKSGGAGPWIWIFLLLVLLAAGAAAYFFFVIKPAESVVEEPSPAPTSEPASMDQPSPAPALPATETASAAELSASAAPPPSAPAPEEAAPPAGAAQPAAPVTPQRRAAAQPAPAGAAKESAKEDEAEQAEKEKAPPFDKSAARTALASAAANAKSSCAKPEGPTGKGRVSVTFVNSGRATRAVVTGAFAGSAVGGCIARIFRNARVPAFSGSSVRVSKSISIP